LYRRALSLDSGRGSASTIPTETFPHVKHATLTLERCKAKGATLFRQLVGVMFDAFGRKSSFLHNTVRVQDAIFEGREERLAEVGHDVEFRTALSGSALPLHARNVAFPRGQVIVTGRFNLAEAARAKILKTQRQMKYALYARNCSPMRYRE